MAKILLTIAGLLMLAFIIVAMYCAMIVAGRSDEQADMENSEGADEMLCKKQICPKCKTGKESYDLDKHSESCPYIGSWKDGKCYFYIPLEKPSRMPIEKEGQETYKHLQEKNVKKSSPYR